MEVYIITLFILFSCGLIDLFVKLSNLQKNCLIFICYAIIVFQIGLRWETGSDWTSYLDNYENLSDYSTVLFNALIGYELGYGTFTFLIKKLVNNYSFFLFLHALIFYWVIFRTSKKYSPYFFISILWIYASNLGLVGSNRQLLAIVICLMGLGFVVDRRFYKFTLIIGLAMLFHTSSFLFGIYYFLNRNIRLSIITAILVLSVIIGNTGIPFFIFSKLGGVFGELSISKTIAYTEGAKDVLAVNSLSIFGLLKRLIFFGIFTLNYSVLSERLSYYRLIYNGYVFGMVIYFLYANSLLVLVSRGSLYFSIMECFLISCQFLVLSKLTDKVFLLLLVFFLAVVVMSQSIAAYPELFIPYKGLFYNLDYNREMF